MADNEIINGQIQGPVVNAGVKISILNADGANTALGGISTSMQKLQSGAKGLQGGIQGLSSSITKLAAIGGVSVSVAKSGEQFLKYNKEIIAVSNSFNKYGESISSVQSQIESFSKQLSLTRGDTTSLMQQYQRGFPLASFNGAEKIFKNIQSAVGSNVEEMQKMLSIASDLATKFPTLQSAIQNLNASDVDRLKNLNLIRLTSGEISAAEYKRNTDYLNLNKQKLASDKEIMQQNKQSQADVQAIKQQFQKISIEVGKTLMPILHTVSGV